MRHDEIRAILDEFAAGRLGGAARGEIRAHLERCAGCRELVDAWAAFAELLDEAAVHPTAEELATAAAEPLAAEARDQARLERHLAGCASCRRQLALTSEALAEAREPRPGRSARRLAWALPRPSPRLALAASILIAAVIAGSLAFFKDSPAPQRPQIAADLATTQVIETRGSLVAGQIAARPGTAITLRGGEVVAFGEGFSVATDTNLVVELSPGAGGRKTTGS